MGVKNIYLDNSATTKVDPEVVKFMNKFMSENYGNPSSLHKLGRDARDAVELSRKTISEFLNVSPSEILFTSGGTEANNLAILGVARANPEKKHIITSNIEHPAVLRVCESLAREGYKVDYIPAGGTGVVDSQDIEKKIRKDTLLVSVMHVNNEIGTIQPVEEIARICRAKGVYFHTDAVQSFGKLNIDASKFDLLSASGHKINAQKGIGFLYVRKGVKIHPLVFGGGQERNLRSGTENVPGIIGLGKAVELARARVKDAEKVKRLRDKLISEILKIPGSRLNGSNEKRIFMNANFSFENVEGESLLVLLDLDGICASTGSACSSTSLRASHVLKAIGLEDLEAHGSLRLSLGWETSSQDVDYTIKKVKSAVEALRKISKAGGYHEKK